MPKINPNLITLCPKKFCDSSLQGFGKEFVCVLFGSGQEISGFAFNPIHFKQVVKGMNSTLKIYEEKNGSINDSNEPILSPIQIDNLGPKDGDKIN